MDWGGGSGPLVPTPALGTLWHYQTIDLCTFNLQSHACVIDKYHKGAKRKYAEKGVACETSG